MGRAGLELTQGWPRADPGLAGQVDNAGGDDLIFSCSLTPINTTRDNSHPSCVTKTLPLWSLTMAPAWSRLASLEMTLPALSSPPSSDVPATRVSWLVWDRRMPMSVMKPSPREVSSP